MDGRQDQGQQQKGICKPAQATADHLGTPVAGVKVGACSQAGLVFTFYPLALEPPGALAIQVGGNF